MKNKVGIILLTLLPFFGKAQDAHLSMYDAAPLYLNPAMTGVFEGDWRIHGQYRTQWKAVNFKPYQSYLLSFDKPIKKWGIGGQLTNFRAGIGNYNAFEGLVSVAYTTPIDKNKYHNFSFGAQGGISQKSVEYQLLSFNNQYTTVNGGGFDMTIPNQEEFAGQSMIVPSVNAGFLYFFAKQQSRLNPFFGASAFNLTQPKETFLGTDNRLPMRYFAHVGTRVNISEVFYLIPKVLVMNQQKFWEHTAAIDAGYYLKEADMYLIGGAFFRTVGWPTNIDPDFAQIANDAFMLSLGAKLEDITVKVGYDVNVSDLRTASTGRGGFEVSVTYVNRKKKPKTEKICPRL